MALLKSNKSFFKNIFASNIRLPYIGYRNKQQNTKTMTQYTIVFDSGRAITDVMAESEEEARYFSEELCLPTEEVAEIYETKR